MMTPEQLRKIGGKLTKKMPDIYGRGWQSALAREVGVNARTVRGWLEGRANIPEPTVRLIKMLVANA